MMNDLDLPNLDQPYHLSDSELTSFSKNGWTCVRGLCSPEEIQTYGDLITKVALDRNKEIRPLEERDTYGRAFLQIMNLWREESRLAQFTLSKRFAGVAAALLGVEKVRLYHDQALFKEPGGGHTPWHQDGYYWPIDQSKTVTMWMPLVDISADMGSMSFASGSQKAGLASDKLAISDDSEREFEAYVEEKKYPVETAGAMKAGDATFHSGLTLHRAPGNPTNRIRSVMTVIYFADGLVANPPANGNQKNDLETWFPGIVPGQLAASALNPVL